MKNDSKNVNVISKESAGSAADLEASEHQNLHETIVDIKDNRNSQKQSKKAFWIILGLVIALLAVGAAAWYFLVYQPSANKSDDDGLSAATKFSSPKALVDEVKPGRTGTVMEVSTFNGVSAVATDSSVIYGAPAYKLSSKAFTVLPEAADGAGYLSDSIGAAENYAAFKRFFEDNKFRLVNEQKDNQVPVSSFENGTVINYAAYESSNIICAIQHTDASASNLKAHVSSIGCAERASYEAAAGKLQAFYDAYMNGDTGQVSNIVMGGLVIEDGSEGYQRAGVYIEDPEQFTEEDESVNSSLSTLFFRKSESDKWQFFNGLDGNPDQLYCSEYSSDDLKKAFKGYTCFDKAANKPSTVS